MYQSSQGHPTPKDATPFGVIEVGLIVAAIAYVIVWWRTTEPAARREGLNGVLLALVVVVIAWYVINVLWSAAEACSAAGSPSSGSTASDHFQ